MCVREKFTAKMLVQETSSWRDRRKTNRIDILGETQETICDNTKEEKEARKNWKKKKILIISFILF